MKYSELLTQVQDAIAVRKVFGEAHESNGVTVIPAASVGGTGPEGEAPGSGGAVRRSARSSCATES